MGVITYGCYYLEEGKQGKRQEKTNQKTFQGLLLNSYVFTCQEVLSFVPSPVPPSIQQVFTKYVLRTGKVSILYTQPGLTLWWILAEGRVYEGPGFSRYQIKLNLTLVVHGSSDNSNNSQSLELSILPSHDVATGFVWLLST